MKTDNEKVLFFEMRVRPVFIGWLLVVLVLIPMLADILLPTGNGKTKALIAATHSEMRTLAELWKQQHNGSVGLRLSTNGALHVTLLSGKQKARLSNCLHRTNSESELLDFWRTSIQFKRSGLSNVVIRSAGPDRKFGNQDAIIFNSASNSFVKP